MQKKANLAILQRFDLIENCDIQCNFLKNANFIDQRRSLTKQLQN